MLFNWFEPTVIRNSKSLGVYIFDNIQKTMKQFTPRENRATKIRFFSFIYRDLLFFWVFCRAHALISRIIKLKKIKSRRIPTRNNLRFFLFDSLAECDLISYFLNIKRILKIFNIQDYILILSTGHDKGLSRP